MTIRAKKILFCILLTTFLVVSKVVGSADGEHPRLILTPERVAALKSYAISTHRNLWELALASADEFSRESIPEMEDAHNRYRYIGDRVPALGLAYLMTEDPRYLDSARKWLSALLSVPEWKGSSNLGRSSWAIGCALLYDWLYDDLGEEMRSQIKERLSGEADIIIETAADWRALSNHLLIETAALGMIGLILSEEANESESILIQTDEWMRYIIEHAPRDGSWGEGVQYWHYGLSHLLRFLEASRTAGHRDYFSEYDWLETTGFFPIYFSLPERPNEVINISDCTVERYIAPFLLFQLASCFENGYYQDYGNKLLLSEHRKFSWMDFICYDPNISPESISKLPTLKHFSDNDFVTMRSSWEKNAIVLGFRCGPAPGHRNQNYPTRMKNRGFGPGHGHPDINSFCIYAYGEWLAIDPGYTHLKQTRNHNTVIVNGHGQAGAGEKWLDYMAFEERKPAPAILRVESTPVYDYVLGDAGNIYVDEAHLKNFRRHLLVLKPSIVVIADDLEGEKDSEFEWLLNAHESIRQIGQDHFEIVRNSVRLSVHPILPTSYTVEIQRRDLDASDVDGEILTLNLKVDSRHKTRFLVVLCVLKDSFVQVPLINLRDEVLTIQHQGKTWEVEFLTDKVMIFEVPRTEIKPDYHFVRDM